MLTRFARGRRPGGHRLGERLAVLGATPALFRYAPGDSLASAIFSRPGAATYVDANGVVQTAADGVPRDAHYINGARHLLLEQQRTNEVAHSEGGSTGITDPSCTLIAGTIRGIGGWVQMGSAAVDRGLAYWYPTSAIPASTTYCGSFFVIMDDGAGPPVYGTDLNILIAGGGVATAGDFGVIDHGNGLYRVWARGSSGAGGGSAYLGMNRIGTRNFKAGGPMYEHADRPSTYVSTGSAAVSVTRSQEGIKWPVSFAPQALTLYVEYMNLGLGINASGGTIAGIRDDQNNAGPRLDLDYQSGSFYFSRMDTGDAYTPGPSDQASVADGGPTWGVDANEIRALLSATGDLQVGRTLNRGAEVLGAVVNTLGALPGAFSSPTFVTLGGAGAAQANPMEAGYRKIIVVPGLQGLDALRAA